MKIREADKTEKEIMTRLSNGENMVEVAKGMKVSVRAVNWAVSILKRVYGASTTTQLIVDAVRNKIID